MIKPTCRRGARRLALSAIALTLLSSPLVGNDEPLIPPSSHSAPTPSPSGTRIRKNLDAPGTPTSIPLRRPAQSSNPPSPSSRISSSIWNTAAALGAICAALVAVSLGLRRRRRSGGGRLPVEAVEVLGRTAVDGRHAISLVRCGSRVLVLSVDATEGLSTLAEINDPEEVNLLVDLCGLPHGGVAAALGQLGQSSDLPPGESAHA
jgi:flagellar biogenesis protein FliO